MTRKSITVGVALTFRVDAPFPVSYEHVDRALQAMTFRMEEGNTLVELVKVEEVGLCVDGHAVEHVGPPRARRNGD